jgi:type II secretory pathway component GspD/PulD (secretin)
MKLIPVRRGRRAMVSALSLTVFALTLPVLVQRAAAQDQSTSGPAGAAADSSETATQPKTDFGSYRTIYLTDTSQHDANDIVTDLRNMLPRAKVYYVQAQGAMSIEGSAADLDAAQKMVSEIDRPRKTYRLTYSLTEMDGDKAVGTQKVSLIALDSGEKTDFKQGSKVPIVTGSTTEDNSTNTQVQYEDVGLSIEAAVDGSPDSLRLRTKVTQSSVPDDRATGSASDPAIRQTMVEAAATLVPGKPLVIGSLDIPGSTRREEISVVSELVP